MRGPIVGVSGCGSGGVIRTNSLHPFFTNSFKGKIDTMKVDEIVHSKLV
jgi:hypothetical protein